jgi:uroporphyrinogen decarboxylase
MPQSDNEGLTSKSHSAARNISSAERKTAVASFAGLRIAALESRRRDDMQRLIERYGGKAFATESMREVQLEDSKDVVDFAYRVLTGEVTVVIFLTGVGFRYLLNVVEKHLDRQRFLDALADITTVVRGPKPAAAMRDVGLQPTHRVPEPNTWRELIEVLDEHVPLANQVVGLQEYGVTNHSLVAALEARGAVLHHVRVYQWDYPADTRPLVENIQAILDGQRDALLFTSAHQAVNLMRMAESMGQAENLRAQIQKLVVGSIGPTTSEMLSQLELPIDFEPDHPKMGHLVQTASEKTHRLLTAKRLWMTIRESRPESDRALHDECLDGPMMRACMRKPSSVTPIWLMRQAGRYMEEYRAVRSKVTFLELCKNPALCAEVMVTAVEKLDVDAAIIFSDILPILEPMGMDLEFVKGDGPVIHNPLRLVNDVDRVDELESMESLEFVMETVRQTRRAINPKLPIIGFSGAPFTLASYMIEGGSSRNYENTKRLMYNDPAAWDVLMTKLARSIARYLNAQIAAGAQIVQLFDSWVGSLGTFQYAQSVQPYVNLILESIVPGVPVINFGTGNPMLLPMFRGDRRTVVGVDWRLQLDRAWEMIGTDRAVQGNIDPLVLFADQSVIKKEVKRILSEAGGRAGHIFNLGHGILPTTPVDNAIALVDMVHEFSQR